MQGLGDWAPAAPTAFMYRLWTGRLIHQGPQGHARISFCYSMKTLDLLSVWCARDVNSLACRASTVRCWRVNLNTECYRWASAGWAAVAHPVPSTQKGCSWLKNGRAEGTHSVHKNVSELNLHIGRESPACADLSVSLSACRLFWVTCHNTHDPLARHRRLFIISGSSCLGVHEKKSQVPSTCTSGPDSLPIGSLLVSRKVTLAHNWACTLIVWEEGCVSGLLSVHW